MCVSFQCHIYLEIRSKPYSPRSLLGYVTLLTSYFRYYIMSFSTLKLTYSFFFQIENVAEIESIITTDYNSPSATMALLHPNRPRQTRPSSMPITTEPCQAVVAPTTPSISISHDGEEGYTPRIFSTMISNARLEDVIRAPPNKTVYDGKSPPPYRSKSFGGASHHHAVVTGSIPSIRSYSMSSSTRRSPHRTSALPSLGVAYLSTGSEVLPPSYGRCLQTSAVVPRPRCASDIHHTRTLGGVPPGYRGGTPPPDYCSVITNTERGNRTSTNRPDS